MDVSILMHLIVEIHHQCFSMNYHVKSIKFNETIHLKWSLDILKPKFGMLDWNCTKIECKSCKKKTLII